MNMKRFLTARRMTKEEVVVCLRQLNGAEMGEITKERAWDIVEELVASGCSVRWGDSGYTAQGYTARSQESEDITCWDAKEVEA